MPIGNLAFALDFPDLPRARPMLERLRGSVGCVKIGLELYVREGPAVVREAAALGFDVFLDLKLHDIPETVARAVAGAGSLGARLLTVHASGGPAMLARAVERAREAASGLQLVGVTVLTSLDDADLALLGVASASGEHAVRLARVGWRAGLRAFVCSPLEVAALRVELGADAMLVTPGIRAPGEAAGDQKRTASPRDAVLRGADLLVVGRPIRDAPDPVAAAAQIVREIDAGLAARAAGAQP
jgi:orotidine-5'-phosphate decarboxylase